MMNTTNENDVLLGELARYGVVAPKQHDDGTITFERVRTSEGIRGMYRWLRRSEGKRDLAG